MKANEQGLVTICKDTIERGPTITWLHNGKVGRAMIGQLEPLQRGVGGEEAIIIQVESSKDKKKIGQRYWVPHTMIIERTEAQP